MLIPLVSPSGDIVEWGLVELQGRIEQQLDVPPGAPLPVGTLQLSPASNDVVQLQVGYHLIEGKRMPLKKPLAIMEQRRQDGGGGGSRGDGMEVDGCDGPPTQPGVGDQGAADATGGCHYEVIGVIRHKYLFKNRPKALISKPTGRAGG